MFTLRKGVEELAKQIGLGIERGKVYIYMHMNLIYMHLYTDSES
jgi:hypothetical protein